VSAAPTPREPALHPIIGASPALRRAVALARRAAPSGLPVLLVGATGTGKELLAQHIHLWSGRRGALVDVNCGALPRDLVEGLLFGRQRGAFTGADDAPGLVEAADRGTLFLDEIASLPLECQPKLLRVLEDGAVRRLGACAKRPVAFGLVAAAQEDVAERLATGALRRDLYQRLAGVVIRLAPLAERPEDVVALADYFAARGGRRLEPETARVLLGYAWPGNVRELRLAVERAGFLVENGTIPAGVMREAIELGVVGGLEPSPDGAGRAQLAAACALHGGDTARIARTLGISRATLFRRLRDAGLSLRGVSRVSRPRETP
jgi:transcriptional regulator with PAS, ATPase and Fis domain